MDVNFVSMIKWNLIWFDIVIFWEKIYYFKAENSSFLQYMLP